MERKKIQLEDSLQDVIVKMAEGNVGALSVLITMLNTNAMDCFLWMLHLDDMDIRGSQIWIGYKYFCNSNLEEFIKCIVTRDQGMIDKINEMSKYED